MTGRVALDIERRGDANFAFITLDRPARANALVPDLVDQLNAAISQARSKDVDALVLRSKGNFFSSGGDVAAFAKHGAQALVDYARHLVGGLQQAVLALYAFPVPVIARLQGGVTGGAAGLAFAADLIAMEKDGFVQPYYSELGFGPDGGWTALLAERIGPAQCFSLQALNRRMGAEEALRLGLADQLANRDNLDGVIDGWLDALALKSPSTIRATKKLLRDEACISRVKDKLEAEKELFLKLIAQPDTALRIQAFLN